MRRVLYKTGLLIQHGLANLEAMVVAPMYDSLVYVVDQIIGNVQDAITALQKRLTR